jgi:hypothetical protein
MSSLIFPGRRVLWLPLDHAWQPPSPMVEHCCTTMAASLVLDCEQHADPFDCPDVPLVYHELFGEYGIPVRDGGMTYVLISNCPWCGAPLPDSSRDLWFDTLEAAGLEDTPTAHLPAHLRLAAWRTRTQS